MSLYEAGVLTPAPAATQGKTYAVLWCPASVNGLRVKEIGMMNTAATGGKVALTRASARGTQTSTQVGQAVMSLDDTAAANGTVDFAWSVDPTVGTNYLRRGHYAAAVGVGIVWQWWSAPTGGLYVPAGAGIALVVPTAVVGVAQEAWFVWDE
jgi:hypothetical protein